MSTTVLTRGQLRRAALQYIAGLRRILDRMDVFLLREYVIESNPDALAAFRAHFHAGATDESRLELEEILNDLLCERYKEMKARGYFRILPPTPPRNYVSFRILPPVSLGRKIEEEYEYESDIEGLLEE